MDKSHYFTLLQHLSHIPQTLTFWGQPSFEHTIDSTYLILKPAYECAAVGVQKVPTDSNDLDKIIRLMNKKYNQKIIVQEYIDGYEISVPVIAKGKDHIALPPVWVKFDGDILTYDTVDNFEYTFSPLPNDAFPYNDIIPSICEHAEKAMQFIGASGLTRIDYRVKNDTEFYVFDIAALPVLAHTGTCMQAFKHLYNDNACMFEAIVGSALY